MGNIPTTKKVQSIFEEAMKIRAAEEFEEIELGWHGTGTAQQPLGGTPLTRAPAQADAGAVQVGAGVTEAVQASAEKGCGGGAAQGGGCAGGRAPAGGACGDCRRASGERCQARGPQEGQAEEGGERGEGGGQATGKGRSRCLTFRSLPILH